MFAKNKLIIQIIKKKGGGNNGSKKNKEESCEEEESCKKRQEKINIFWKIAARPDNDKFIYALSRSFSLLCYLRKKKDHLNTGEKIKILNTRIKKWDTFVSHFFILSLRNSNIALFVIARSLERAERVERRRSNLAHFFV